MTARTTHCAKGHKYDDVNSYISSRVRRVCRPCHRDLANAYNLRKRLMAKPCTIEGCSGICVTTKLCSKHDYNSRKNGHPLKVQRVVGENRRKHPLYATYCAMRARCYAKSCPKYHYYGGRGIKMCDRWLGPYGFTHFVEDMGPKPSPEYSIDRTNNDGNYEPGNCRWATKAEQTANRRPRISKKTGKREAQSHNQAETPSTNSNLIGGMK